MKLPKLRLWIAAVLFVVALSLLLVSTTPAPRARLVLPMPDIQKIDPAGASFRWGGL